MVAINRHMREGHATLHDVDKEGGKIDLADPSRTIPLTLKGGKENEQTKTVELQTLRALFLSPGGAMS